MKPTETCPGDCSLACPVCARRFWKWAENHTRGRVPKANPKGPSFYEAAAKYQTQKGTR
jgi:hypothetical protein